MTITFIKSSSSRKVSLECPSCSSSYTLIYTEKSKTTEICPSCSNLHCVQMYPNGMIVID